MKEKFYDNVLPHLIIVDVRAYKNISLAHYTVPRETVKFVPVVPKAHGRATFCAHRKTIKLYNFLNHLEAFHRGWFVVVHPCSNFSLCRQMAPLRSIKFQTADFPNFCSRIIVIFRTTCIAREVFSVMVMGNGKHVLPVLHCLKRGISFVSSSYLLLSSVLQCCSFVFCFAYQYGGETISEDL